MFRNTLMLVALALPMAAAAQVPMSRQDRAWSYDCRRLADSMAFVVAKTQAGASDAQIQADMRLFNMRPLPDRLRAVLIAQAGNVTTNEVLQVGYANCMQGEH